MDSIEGSSAQQVSSEIRKKLDYSLTPQEIAAVKSALQSHAVQLRAYRADSLTPDRKLFEFARSRRRYYRG